MKRGELYLVRKPGGRGPAGGDPRKQRVFIVASRQALVDSRFSSLICAPIYSQHDGISTQVGVGPDEGLKKESSIHCDQLVSVPKVLLTHYVGSLKRAKLKEFDAALGIAVGLENPVAY
jgi:mRNA interferase MazF